MRKFILLSVFLVMNGLIWGCASKEIKKQHQTAKNRQMALVVFNIQRGSETAWPDQSFLDSISESLRTALGNFYGNSTLLLKAYNEPTIQKAGLFFEYGDKRIDDLFALSGRFEKEADLAHFVGSLVIRNGHKFNTVVDIPIEVRSAEVSLSSAINQLVIKTMGEKFSNPNDFPRNNVLFFADQLFQWAKKKEEEIGEVQDCDGIKRKYDYFRMSFRLYDRVVKGGAFDVYGMESARFQITSNMEEAAEKTKFVDACEQDVSKSFAMIVDFGKVAQDYRPAVEAGFRTADLEAWFRKYTNKPVMLNFQTEETGISLLITMRYHEEHYKAILKKFNIPEDLKGTRILALDPYFPLFKRIILFQHSIPVGAPSQIRVAIEKMPVSFLLEKIIGDSVQMTVRGQVSKAGVVLVANPIELIARIRGFDTRTIRAKNDELFQAKGWLTLGACRGIDGSLTEDGLLYRFFNFPCH